ncbi:MAG: LacI family DNA-binding transcriptional regulator [Actinobacteria bacterium]|nr:LacI family DNA-binding transcriptional regulator [Actinomycetota bacterium]
MNKKNKTPKVNIYYIAKEVGVSVATISRFFNNETLVKESTKTKILKVCQKYNYKPSKIASAITTKSTKSIAFIVPSLKDPTFVELISGAELAMSKKGYSMTLFNTRQNIFREREIIDTLDSMIIDGVIFSGVYGGEEEKIFISEVQKRNIPIILVDRIIPDINIPFVMSNDYLGGKLAAKFILENNHKKIGIVTYFRKVFIFNERVQGFIDVLKQAGINEIFIEEVPLEYNKIEEALIEKKDFILKSDVTAIFCVADSIAIFLSRILMEDKIKIPDEISIMGYDNLFFSNYLVPGLTTINHDMYEIGKMAAENLIHRLETGRFKNKKIVIDPVLLPRDSVKNLKNGNLNR